MNSTSAAVVSSIISQCLRRCLIDLTQIRMDRWVTPTATHRNAHTSTRVPRRLEIIIFAPHLSHHRLLPRNPYLRLTTTTHPMDPIISVRVVATCLLLRCGLDILPKLPPYDLAKVPFSQRMRILTICSRSGTRPSRTDLRICLRVLLRLWEEATEAEGIIMAVIGKGIAVARFETKAALCHRTAVYTMVSLAAVVESGVCVPSSCWLLSSSLLHRCPGFCFRKTSVQSNRCVRSGDDATWSIQLQRSPAVPIRVMSAYLGFLR